MLNIKILKHYKIETKLFQEFKKIKPDSLICSFSKILFEKYFNYLKKNKGIIIIAYKSKQIVGILIFERSSKITLDFLEKNKFEILLNLFLSKYLSDKKILFFLVINYFFFKKKIKFFKNNILLIAVNKNYRRKKIGKRMITFLRKKIKQSIFVMTDRSNNLAKSFYKQNKFYFLKNINYGNRSLSIFYSKKLY